MMPGCCIGGSGFFSTFLYSRPPTLENIAGDLDVLPGKDKLGERAQSLSGVGQTFHGIGRG